MSTEPFVVDQNELRIALSHLLQLYRERAGADPAASVHAANTITRMRSQFPFHLLEAEDADKLRTAIKKCEDEGYINLTPGQGVASKDLHEMRADAFAVLTILESLSSRTVLTKRGSQPGGSVTPNSLIRRGGMWEVSFEGRSFPLRDSKGLHYLALLLDRAGESISSVQMAATVSGAPDTPNTGSKGELSDSQAISEYKARYKTLMIEKDQAERHDDPIRLAEVQKELRDIALHLSQVTGLGGRVRDDSDANRAQRAVKMALDRTTKAISKADAGLGNHLANSIITGHQVTYRPAKSIYWEISK